MEHSKKNVIDIESLKNDIIEQEMLMNKYIKEANNMFYLIIVSTICSICFLLLSKFIFSAIFFILGFLCLRRYNKSIGMAEIHNGLRKFLKMILLQEQTGEDVIRKLLQ